MKLVSEIEGYEMGCNIRRQLSCINLVYFIAVQNDEYKQIYNSMTTSTTTKSSFHALTAIREINLLIELVSIAYELPCYEIDQRWGHKVQLDIHIGYSTVKSENAAA